MKQAKGQEQIHFHGYHEKFHRTQKEYTHQEELKKDSPNYEQ
ncbi:MAG: hypothetical protein ACP5P0_05570 [Hydrogenobacter sp.]